MIFVVDSNIVFSALLNPSSVIGEILIDVSNKFQFCAPEMMKYELDKYEEKIKRYSKLSSSEISILKDTIYSSINFISEELISEETWKKAFELTKQTDEKDTPFVALALELNTKLWSGDKKLQAGMKYKNRQLIIQTKEVLRLK
ncbi:MAG: PIN domain-containing protein [Agriterribacter sp.]